MADKSKARICTYCGESKAPWDEDHVPPQSIIGFDHDHKVPSCKECNGGASKDDEYFLFAVTMAKVSDNYRHIRRYRKKVFRSLGKKKAKRYRELILRNANPPSLPENEIDFGNYLERIRNVAYRIIKGLYYLKYGARITSSHQITVFIGNEYRAYGTENTKRFNELFSPLLKEEETSVGDPGVFTYCSYQVDSEDPASSIWFLQFFEGYKIFAHVLIEEDERCLATHFPAIHNLHLLPKLATIFVPSCGDLSEWVEEQLGGELTDAPPNNSGFPSGVIPILHGKLGDEPNLS